MVDRTRNLVGSSIICEMGVEQVDAHVSAEDSCWKLSITSHNQRVIPIRTDLDQVAFGIMPS